MKILIIEDDPIVARVYSTKYAAAEFESCVAEDGETGLRLVKTFKPDLVHLDLMIPKTNGVDVIKSIRKDPATRTLPIIVLSNTYQNALIKDALAAGATRCVSKASCTPKMMFEIVSKFAIPAAAPVPAPPLALVASPTPVLVVAPVQTTVAAPAQGAVARVSPRPPARFPAAVRSSVPAAGTAESVSTPDPTPASKTREFAKHLAFQAEIHGDFAKRAPILLSTVRDHIEPLLRAEPEGARILHLTELRRTARTLAGHAGVAGFQELSEMASGFEALLGELIENPAGYGPSAARTIVDVVDALSQLLAQTTEAPEGTHPPLVLVIDDDSASRQSIVDALGRLNASTVTVSGAQAALQLLAENKFNLIFIDAALPEKNGFDLCAELRTLQPNQSTPVELVTDASGFEERDRCLASGGTDLIAKPFLPMELAVKASSLLRRGRFQRSAQTGEKERATAHAA